MVRPPFLIKTSEVEQEVASHYSRDRDAYPTCERTCFWIPVLRRWGMNPGVVQEHSDAVFRIGLPRPLISYSFVKQAKIRGAPWHGNLPPRLPVNAAASRHSSRSLPSAQSLGRNFVQNEIVSTEEESPCRAVRASDCNIPQACARIWFQ